MKNRTLCVELKREKSIHHHSSIQGANLGNLNVTKWGTIIIIIISFWLGTVLISLRVVVKVRTWHHSALTYVFGIIFFDYLYADFLHKVYCYANFLYIQLFTSIFKRNQKNMNICLQWTTQHSSFF